MRIGIQTWGTEGDVRPCLALAGGLSGAGHDVTLAVTEITNKRFDAFGARMGFRVRHVGRINVDQERYRYLAGRVFRVRDTLLEDRLISRFNWGLVARIDRPCYETRVAILRKKARQRNIDLPEAVASFIAGTIDSNTRELEGAVAKVAMLAQVTGRPIELDLAAEALGDDKHISHREITIDDILNVVTQRYGVRLIDLQSKKRTRSIALPRQICMYLARSLTRHSLEEIGGYFGGRDHTTVLHANRTVESMRTDDPQFQANLEKLSEDIQAGL